MNKERLRRAQKIKEKEKTYKPQAVNFMTVPAWVFIRDRNSTFLFYFLFSLTCPDYFLFLCLLPGIVRERENEKEMSSCPFFLSGLIYYVQASRYAERKKD